MNARGRWVEQTLARMTASVDEKGPLLSAGLAYKLLREPFWVWCELHAPEREREEAAESRYDARRIEAGARHEDEVIGREFSDARDLRNTWGAEGFRATLEAIAAGAPSIRGAYLLSLPDGIQGRADILVRAPGRTPSGLPCYRVVEVKGSRARAEHHVVQAGLYATVVASAIGEPIQSAELRLRETTESLAAGDLAQASRAAVERWRAIRDGRLCPEPPGPGKTSPPWSGYADRLLAKRDDLTLLPGVGEHERARLRRVTGATDVRSLRALGLPRLRAMLTPRRAEDLFHAAEARRTGRVIPKRRATKLPAATPIFFDIETHADLVPGEPPHIYLFGAYDPVSNRYAPFVARGADQEERALREFFQFLARHPGRPVVHWSAFESRELANLGDRHPSSVAAVETVRRRLLDLLPVIRGGWHVPVRGYSIKELAPLCGFRWRRSAVGDGLEAMSAYADWLEGGRREQFEPVLAYNEDDCRAMHAVLEAFRAFARGGIA